MLMLNETLIRLRVVQPNYRCHIDEYFEMVDLYFVTQQKIYYDSELVQIIENNKCYVILSMFLYLIKADCRRETLSSHRLLRTRFSGSFFHKHSISTSVRFSHAIQLGKTHLMRLETVSYMGVWVANSSFYISAF